ncbi:extensin (proline-rich protein), putative [Theileria annulata]|uniref:Extensin (Proline-rich protein), putative n=1 Tax=Theileria annulata TaxID=5874 RepID=Q4UCY9_THEAN|nr:extensin (proline-rich protein), putative [Theileria annulata]CAI75312.1 extensin (proline-rich protein), putative [Theileria annulata]|eukprot:XP_954788.1 extensin (proline-rich protein), putative [Theileria annulata]
MSGNYYRSRSNSPQRDWKYRNKYFDNHNNKTFPKDNNFKRYKTYKDDLRGLNFEDPRYRRGQSPYDKVRKFRTPDYSTSDPNYNPTPPEPNLTYIPHEPGLTYIPPEPKQFTIPPEPSQFTIAPEPGQFTNPPEPKHFNPSDDPISYIPIPKDENTETTLTKISEDKPNEWNGFPFPKPYKDLKKYFDPMPKMGTEFPPNLYFPVDGTKIRRYKAYKPYNDPLKRFIDADELSNALRVTMFREYEFFKNKLEVSNLLINFFQMARINVQMSSLIP